MNITFFKLAIGASIYIYSPLGISCRGLSPTSEKTKQKADIVFEGNLLNYEYKNDLGHIHYEVVETLKGEKRAKWKVTIRANVNWKPPKSETIFRKCFGKTQIVGLKKATEKEHPVAQDTCNPPFIIQKGKKQRTICAGFID